MTGLAVHAGARIPHLAGSACANTGAVNRIDPSLFVTPGGVITFTEYAGGTPDPVYTPAQYGAVGLWQPGVRFASYLNGQSNVAPNYSIGGTPTLPLAVDLLGPGTFIATDSARPVGETKCLSGTPSLSGSIVMLFDVDVVGVMFNVGFMNVMGTLTFQALDRSGNVIYSGVNDWINGYADVALNRDSNDPIIAAVELFVNIGVEGPGYSLSMIKFSNTCA